ncbi:MAG: hemerythrin [Comamonadaceae bacterium]|nr:MAG: hemerythrin [Comamonadaceae bacterium]
MTTTTLRWSDALALDLPLMDETHQEFVELLGQAERAPDAALVPAWHALVSHTEAHFGQEDRWMAATGFASANCHSLQHRAVLRAMREGLLPGRDAVQQCALIREMAAALGPWFVQHARSMDAALALHLRGVGYDPETGQVHAPDALPQALITRCGSVGCGERQATQEPATIAGASDAPAAMPA